MKEPWSVSKEKLMSLEEGQPAETSAIKIKETRSSFKTLIQYVKLILYIELALFTGWAFYSLWQTYHIESMEVTVTDVIREPHQQIIIGSKSIEEITTVPPLVNLVNTNEEHTEKDLRLQESINNQNNIHKKIDFEKKIDDILLTLAVDELTTDDSKSSQDKDVISTNDVKQSVSDESNVDRSVSSTDDLSVNDDRSQAPLGDVINFDMPLLWAVHAAIQAESESQSASDEDKEKLQEKSQETSWEKETAASSEKVEEEPYSEILHRKPEQSINIPEHLPATVTPSYTDSVRQFNEMFRKMKELHEKDSVESDTTSKVTSIDQITMEDHDDSSSVVSDSEDVSNWWDHLTQETQEISSEDLSEPLSKETSMTTEVTTESNSDENVDIEIRNVYAHTDKGFVLHECTKRRKNGVVISDICVPFDKDPNEHSTISLPTDSSEFDYPYDYEDVARKLRELSLQTHKLMFGGKIPTVLLPRTTLTKLTTLTTSTFPSISPEETTSPEDTSAVKCVEVHPDASDDGTVIVKCENQNIKDSTESSSGISADYSSEATSESREGQGQQDASASTNDYLTPSASVASSELTASEQNLEETTSVEKHEAFDNIPSRVINTSPPLSPNVELESKDAENISSPEVVEDRDSFLRTLSPLPSLPPLPSFSQEKDSEIENSEDVSTSEDVDDKNSILQTLSSIPPSPSLPSLPNSSQEKDSEIENSRDVSTPAENSDENSSLPTVPSVSSSPDLSEEKDSGEDNPVVSTPESTDDSREESSLDSEAESSDEIARSILRGSIIADSSEYSFYPSHRIPYHHGSCLTPYLNRYYRNYGYLRPLSFSPYFPRRIREVPQIEEDSVDTPVEANVNDKLKPIQEPSPDAESVPVEQ